MSKPATIDRSFVPGDVVRLTRVDGAPGHTPNVGSYMTVDFVRDEGRTLVFEDERVSLRADRFELVARWMMGTRIVRGAA